MNRLKEETSVFDIDYTYDSMGNRTQEVEGAVTTNYTYSNMMRLLSKTEGGTSTTFGYDRNGNLTSKTEGNSSYTYVWDYDNRLKEVRQNGNVLFSYAYDPNGRRVRSLNSGTGVTTTYIYAGINVIHEATSSESTDYLYANGMRIAKKTGATVKYFHSDHLGSTRLVTDSSGQPTFESDYKPFGQEANATGTEKYAFTGQYNEADIGLYYFGARWYDASLGRFISEDPLKGSMISSQSQNPYVYCMNNPLRFVDPTGMLMSDPHPYVPGTIQTYYGGEWHYYSEAGGVVDSSGPGMNYTQAKDAYDRRVRDDFYAKQDQSYFDRAEKLLRSTMTRHYWNSKGMLDWYNQQISGKAGSITLNTTPGVPSNNDPIVQKNFWERGGTKLVGGTALINGGAALTYAAAAGYTFGAIPSATGIGIPATIGVWAASTGAAYLGANMMVYGLAYTAQGAEELGIISTKFDDIIFSPPPTSPWWN